MSRLVDMKDEGLLGDVHELERVLFDRCERPAWPELEARVCHSDEVHQVLLYMPWWDFHTHRWMIDYYHIWMDD